MRRIYLDACIAIYLIEKHPDFATKVEAMIQGLDGNDILYYSPLSKMECLVMPLRTADADLISLYGVFFDEQEMLSISPDCFYEAARLRANFISLKTPDALHIATALHYNCDEFWTNDDRLNSVASNMVRNVLSD